MNRYLVLGAILAASFAVVAVETAGGVGLVEFQSHPFALD